ncbi:MAG: tautomerase family protein [SAR324 cluster bacterium]|nr:tautomerase family protein [SAR324 cluster bacterium]
MPSIAVHITPSWESFSKKVFASKLQDILVLSFGIPKNDRLIRIFEYLPEDFYLPLNLENAYILIEVTLFPGRTLDQKRKFYQAVNQLIADSGHKTDASRVILIEAPPENWGIRSGQSGIDVIKQKE